MERVVTVNLNGNSYSLEEPAYEALRAYLDRADAALTANPDKSEILRDLEQAIAEKSSTHLSSHKSVVTGPEMTQVLEEMGPVMGEQDSQPENPQATDPPLKRLYRIRDRAWIAGICTGLSAYLDIDVVIVRLAAVILGFITGGWAFLIYLIAMFIIPSAQTSAEWAAAHGMAFNTQKIIEQAQREYRSMAENMSRSWRRSIRTQRRAQRRERRRQAWTHWDSGPPLVTPPAPVGYLTRILSGIVGFVLSLISAALLIALLIAVFALINVGAVLGWAPPADVPIWLAVIIVLIVYGAVSTPLAYLRRAAYAAASGYRLAGGLSDSFITLIVMIGAGALAYQFSPQFREWIELLPETLRAIGERLETL
jgi:phage shock protein PspC (stress-responsive transcriptional regulator)